MTIEEAEYICRTIESGLRQFLAWGASEEQVDKLAAEQIGKFIKEQAR